MASASLDYDPRLFEDPLSAVYALAAADLTSAVQLSAELIASFLVTIGSNARYRKDVLETAAEITETVLDKSKNSKEEGGRLRARFEASTKGGETPFGSAKAWADGFEDIETLNEPALVEQERKLNVADVSKDAKEIQSTNLNFRATRKAMFGEIGKEFKMVIREEVDDSILGKADYDNSPRIQKVCWLQPFDAKNSVKKGRREYPKTGDLPETNKLSPAISIGFHDVGFTLDEFPNRIKEIVSPGAYIDPGSRQKANDKTVLAWDGTIPLPKELFDIYGFNTQPSFKLNGLKGELLAGNEMRITLDLTYSGERTTYTMTRTVSQEHKGGGLDYCAGNPEKRAWFTEHSRGPPTKDAYLFVLLKELGDFLQVIYAKLYMGHANPQICLFTNDKTVLGRCFKVGVPVCFRPLIKETEEKKRWENLGQCYYFFPHFDPILQRKSLKLTYQTQCIQHNSKVKTTIARALLNQGTRHDDGMVYYISCGGQDITEIGGTAGEYPTIRKYLSEDIVSAIDAATKWLDVCIGTLVDVNTDESVEQCKGLAARATAEIVCNEVMEISKLRSLFKPSSVTVPAGVPALVDPVADEFRRTGRRLNDHILFLSSKQAKKGAAARAARKRGGGTKSSASRTTLKSKPKSNSKSVRHPISVKYPLPSIKKRNHDIEIDTNQTTTGMFYDLSFLLIQRNYMKFLLPLMTMDHYEASQIKDFYEEYLHDLAYEFLCYSYNYLNYVGRAPIYVPIVSELLTEFIKTKTGEQEAPTLEEFQRFYRTIETKEMGLLEEEEEEEEVIGERSPVKKSKGPIVYEKIVSSVRRRSHKPSKRHSRVPEEEGSPFVAGGGKRKRNRTRR
jgi:hypothetical protein